jgi:hypothetical protein
MEMHQLPHEAGRLENGLLMLNLLDVALISSNTD